MKATMKEVAARAGVSVATVSHVINESGLVKEETKQRVVEAIRDLNYSPNIMARTFKTGKKNTMGFIVPDIGSNFFASIIEEIENVLAQSSYKLIVANTREDTKREVETIRMMTSGLVDGLIISSAFTDFDLLKEYLPKKNNFPVIFVGRETLNCTFDSVTISDYSATRQSVEHLIQKGHKRIGYVSGLKYLSPIRERLRAYCDVLEENHIPFDQAIVRDVRYHAFDAIKDLIEQKCTAIVAATNNVTYDAIIYFLNHGISLKNDVALVGYINDGSTSTELKSMVQILHPIKEMGLLAVNQLFERMKNPELPTKNIVLMGRFVPPVF